MFVAFSWTEERWKVRFAEGESRVRPGAVATTCIPDRVSCMPNKTSLEGLGDFMTGDPEAVGKISSIWFFKTSISS
jgi:hypothetical protein